MSQVLSTQPAQAADQARPCGSQGSAGGWPGTGTACHHREPWLCSLPQAVPAAICILGRGRTMRRIFHKQPEREQPPALPDLRSSSCFNATQDPGPWFSILPPPLHKGHQDLKIAQKTPGMVIHQYLYSSSRCQGKVLWVWQDMVGGEGIKASP